MAMVARIVVVGGAVGVEFELVMVLGAWPSATICAIVSASRNAKS
jgi:hypothetical protein